MDQKKKFILISGTTFVEAVESGRVSGLVTDPDGASVAGAKLTLTSSNGNSRPLAKQVALVHGSRPAFRDCCECIAPVLRLYSQGCAGERGLAHHSRKAEARRLRRGFVNVASKRKGRGKD